jgi:protein-tyrosine-phosphatase
MSLDAGRRAPEAAVEVGRCFGVELGDHRSRILDAETVRSCDVVFAMDSANLLSLYRTFPDSMHKVFLLDAAREIPDPYGGDLERFASVYAQIAAAIDSLCRAG